MSRGEACALQSPTAPPAPPPHSRSWVSLTNSHTDFTHAACDLLTLTGFKGCSVKQNIYPFVVKLTH